MRPINGRCAMTPEEKNARRRELDADPFHRALTRKTAKKWRDRNREKLNARRREKYAQDPESARRKANRVLTVAGLSHTVSEWARLTGIGKTTIKERLRRGWSVERALGVCDG